MFLQIFMFNFLLFLSTAISLSPSLVSLYDCHHLQLCSPAVSGQKRNPLSPTCSSQSTHAILDFHSSSGEHQLPNLDSLHNREIFSHQFFCANNRQRDEDENNSHPQQPALVSSSNPALRWFSWLCCSFFSLLWVVSHLILFVKLQRHGCCPQIVMYGISWIIKIDEGLPHKS